MGTYTDASGQLVPREWVNLDNNFDNIGQAFLTLFITATLDGYTPAMYMSMATRWGTVGVLLVVANFQPAWICMPVCHLGSQW